MKRLRFERWSGQWLGSRSVPCSRRNPPHPPPHAPPLFGSQPSFHKPPPLPPIRFPPTFARCQSTTVARSNDNAAAVHQAVVETSSSISGRRLETSPPLAEHQSGDDDVAKEGSRRRKSSGRARPPLMASPLPSKARSSAKLNALHSRLSLSRKLPLETLARALVDASANPNRNFNNSSLAYLGATAIHYHTCEWLVCRFPRLPLAVLCEVMRSYSGDAALQRVARQWGVEAAASPGGEVDPGLLQWSNNPVSGGVIMTQMGYKPKRRTTNESSAPGSQQTAMPTEPPREAFADVFGGDDEIAEVWKRVVLTPADQMAAERAERSKVEATAFATAVRAVIGAIFIHLGRDGAKSFVRAHILSRATNMEAFFKFYMPTKELTMLCAREGFEAPVARLLSETGRLSRHPVFVVGIYSGSEKLGEAEGPSLDFARIKAAMNALKAWYLYSPGEHVRVPSDMLHAGAERWSPVHVDMGEIV